MKIPKIAQALNQVDDKYVTDADISRAQKKSTAKPLMITFGGICAAAAAFTLITRTGLLSGNNPEPPVDSELPAHSTTASVDLPISDPPISSSTPIISSGSEVSEPPISSSAPIISSGGETSTTEITEPPVITPVEIDYSALPFEYKNGALEKIGNLKIEAGGGGGGGSFKEIKKYNEDYPWSEDMYFPELPVFRTLTRGTFYPEDYLPLLEKYAATIGEELTDIVTLDSPFAPPGSGIVYSLKAKAGDVSFFVDIFPSSGILNIHIYDLPEDIDPTEFVCFENPVYKKDPYDRKFFYESSEDPLVNFLNYNLRTAWFTEEYGRKLDVSEAMSVSECMGMYPAISAEQAKEQLVSGNYKSLWSGHDFPAGKGKEAIKYMCLVYRFTGMCEYNVPFYEIWAETESGEYDMFYVPAIAPEYLAGTNAESRPFIGG